MVIGMGWTLDAADSLRGVQTDDNVLVSSEHELHLITLSYMTITPSLSTTRDIVYSFDRQHVCRSWQTDQPYVGASSRRRGRIGCGLVESSIN